MFQQISRHLKIFVLCMTVGFLSSCTLDARIGTDLLSESISKTFNRIDPDSLPTENYISTGGYEIIGTVGEVSQKITLPSGYELDGVFYE
ncbi:hypothetical protein D3C72_2323290 [compost metagenome]